MDELRRARGYRWKAGFASVSAETGVGLNWQAGGVNAFGSALLVTGSEPLLAERAVDERTQAALTQQPDADVQRIDASELDDLPLAEVVGSSLFASRIVAIIDDVGATPASQLDAVVETAAHPGDDLCLILVHHGGVKGKKLLDALKKAKVETVKVEPIKPWQLPDFVRAEAKAQGSSINADGAQALVAAVGTDLRALSGAVAQLIDDAEGQPLDAPVVRKYFAGRAEVTSFAVADAVLAGKNSEAIEQLRWALNTGVAHVLITSAMAGGFRSMAKYLDARSERLRGAELTKATGLPPWKLKNYDQWGRFWTHAGVAEGLKIVATADAAVKGASSTPEYALEKMVLDLLAQRHG